MANLIQSVASGLGELKHFYDGPIVDQLNGDLPIYRACEKIKKGWSGDQVNRPLRVRRNQGIGATTDGGLLPSIGRQTTVQATINVKYNYLRFGITGGMIAASQSDKGSFVRSAAYELEKGYEDLSSDLSRQLSWDGTGDLATVNTAATASTSLVIKGRESTEEALKFVDVGLVFDVYTSAGALVQSNITVNSISSGTAISATATLVCDQPVTCSANDILVRSGSFGNEIQGLLYALDGGTSTIYGVDRSLYQAYQGNVTDAASAQLTLDLMQQPFNQGLRRGSMRKYNAVWTDFASLRYYQKLLTPDKRYNNISAQTKGDGSFGNAGEFYMDFNGLPIVPDKDCPTRFFMLNAQALKMYEQFAMQFADETGSMYIAQTDTDALEVRIRHFTNMFNEAPASAGVLTGYISP